MCNILFFVFYAKICLKQSKLCFAYLDLFYLITESVFPILFTFSASFQFFFIIFPFITFIFFPILVADANILTNLNDVTFQKTTVAEGDEEKVSLKSSIKGMPVDDVSNLVRKKLKRSVEDETQGKTKRTKGDGDPENAAIDSSP